MRVLITGAGLVGAHAAAGLAAAGHVPLLVDLRPDPRYIAAIAGPEVPFLSCDATDAATLVAALREHRADAVVHTAGLLGRKCDRHPLLAFRVNAGAAAAVAEAARQVGVRRLVQVSSLAVYDWPTVPVGQSSVDEDFPTAPRTPYAASKLAGELAVGCYQASGWLDVTVLRPAGVYGPGHFRGGSLFGGLLQRMVASAMDGEPVTVPASLSGHEYLHAGDVARVILRALELSRTGTYNVGTGRIHRGTDVAAALSNAIPGTTVSAAQDPIAAEVPLSVLRAKRELPGWSCRSLAAGLAELASTLRSHPWLAKEDNP